jgi:hypothetical protein
MSVEAPQIVVRVLLRLTHGSRRNGADDGDMICIYGDFTGRDLPRRAMRRARIYLAGILILHIGYIALHEVRYWNNFPDGDMDKVPGPAAYWVPLLILLYLWCRADAKDRNVDFPLLSSVLVPLFFPIGVPYYFLRTYDLRRAVLHIGLAAIFAAACFAVAKLTFMLAFYYLIAAP